MEILIKKLIEQLQLINQRLDVIEEKLDEQLGENGGSSGCSHENDGDEMLDEAVRLVVGSGTASASFLQRRLKVGYARAARLLDLMEEKGVVGPSRGAKPRDILVDY